MNRFLRRRALIGLLALAWIVPAHAQQIDTGTVTANSSGGGCTGTANACASFVPPFGTVTITLQVTGTYTGTLTFEATSDNVTWFTITGTNLVDGSTASTTTSTGQFSFRNSGLVGIRARATATWTGAATIVAVRGYANALWLSPFLGSVTFTNGTKLSDPSGAGELLLAGTTPMIQLGGTTSSFPAIKRNGAVVDMRLADDSAGAQVNATVFSFSSALLRNGVLVVSNTAPSSPASCGTSPAVTTSNGSVSWVITGGTGGVATGCTVTMPTALTGWNCNITDITATAAHRANVWTVQTASTTTSISFEYQTVSTGAATAFTASDVFRGICVPY